MNLKSGKRSKPTTIIKEHEARSASKARLSPAPKSHLGKDKSPIRQMDKGPSANKSQQKNILKSSKSAVMERGKSAAKSVGVGSKKSGAVGSKKVKVDPSLE